MGQRRMEADLSWFWTWSEGEMSAPSNFMAMANAISLGCSVMGGLPKTDIDEGRLNAASRARPISRALAKLGPLDRRVLYAAFGPDAQESPGLGKMALVALLTPLAAKAYRASHTTHTLEEWLLRLAWRVNRSLGDQVPEDSATLHGILAQANAMLAQATHAYLTASNGRPTMPARAARARSVRLDRNSQRSIEAAAP